MRKLKVFLSKSRAGDLDTQLLTKDILLKAGIEICEYTGGDYSPDLMLSCDLLIMIPARTKRQLGKGYSTVGKGQSDEIDIWVKTKKYHSIFIVNSVTKDSIFLNKYQFKDLNDANDWKISHSYLIMDNDNTPVRVNELVIESKLNNLIHSVYLNLQQFENANQTFPMDKVVKQIEDIFQVKPMLACYAKIRK